MTAEAASELRPAEQVGRNRKTLIVGNSHTQMIRDAIAVRAANGTLTEDIEVCWLISRGKGEFGDTSREDAMAKIRSLGPSDLLVTSLIGTLHNIAGLFNHEHPFALIACAGESPEPDAATEIIPRNVMRDVFKEHVEGNQFFEQMVKAAPCLVVHFIPPPPKEAFAKGGKTRVVDGVQVQLEYAPGHDRLALWKLEEQVVARYLSGLKVYHYSVPLNASTPDGFLLPGYHASDATHANAAFGELLLRDFERMLHGAPRRP
jgi:hypothetical protein